jgi:hypothetical protein
VNDNGGDLTEQPVQVFTVCAYHGHGVQARPRTTSKYDPLLTNIRVRCI